MKICVIGSGYVGLVTGISFADLGNDVIGVDIDEDKVDMLNKGKLPIYEPGLSDKFERNLKQERIYFTTDIKKGIQDSDIIFICVQTPMGSDHRADLSAVLDVAQKVGKYINRYKVIIDKSTVPVGTGKQVKKTIKENMPKGSDHDFDVVSNPEFLREGNAVRDFNHPDRIVVGTRSRKAREIMEDIYKGIARTEQPIMFTDLKSAEIIKYASNAMLATRISFMNMLAPLCEKTGADIKEVAKGMGLDKRIGSRFLQAGIGYGGSCFPKDVNALLMTLEDHSCDASILKSVEEINEKQKLHIIPKVKKLLPDMKGMAVAVWGIAFKPKTDDIREAPSLLIIEELQKLGAKIKAFDPEAQENAKKILKDVSFFPTPYEALDGADCLVICTEWDEFRNLDKEEIKGRMKKPNIVDGRNIFDQSDMKESGFNYIGVGR